VDKLSALGNEIAMLNAEVGKSCEPVYDTVFKWEQLIRSKPADEAAGFIKKLDGQTRDLVAAMRADLNMAPRPICPSR